MHGYRVVSGRESQVLVRSFFLEIDDLAYSNPGREFIDSFLQKRVHDRMTASAAKDHHWFSETESKEELDRLYNLHVVRGIHRPDASGCE
jgi:hypothetical protein